MADKKIKENKSDSTAGKNILILSFFFAALLPILSGLIVYIVSPLKLLMAVRQYFSPFFAANFWWIETVSLILSALFLWGTISIIIKANYIEIKKEEFLDYLGKDYLSRHRSLKGWMQIKKRLRSEDLNDWKLAILEADHILNEILKRSGYLGKNLENKLDLLTPAQLANVEDIKRAHSVRDKIVNDPTFMTTREETTEVIKVYRQSFIELNLIKE